MTVKLMLMQEISQVHVMVALPTMQIDMKTKIASMFTELSGSKLCWPCKCQSQNSFFIKLVVKMLLLLFSKVKAVFPSVSISLSHMEGWGKLASVQGGNSPLKVWYTCASQLFSSKLPGLQLKTRK